MAKTEPKPDPNAPTQDSGSTGDPGTDEPTREASTKTKAKAKAVPALRIRSVPESFCRAGRRWTREVQVVPLSEFTPDQVEALMAEPNLAVVETELEA